MNGFSVDGLAMVGEGKDSTKVEVEAVDSFAPCAASALTSAASGSRFRFSDLCFFRRFVVGD